MELADMQIEYRNNLSKNFMILNINSTEVNYKTKMIGNNTINGLLRTSNIIIDGGQQFMYEISSLQSLDILFERKKLSSGDLKEIIRCFIEAVNSMEEYLLNANGIILESSMIYMNPENRKVYFTYNPFYDKSMESQLESISRFFIEHIDYSDNDSVKKAYTLSSIVGKKPFEFNSLQVLLEETQEESNDNPTDNETVYKEEIYMEKKQEKLWDKLVGGIFERFKSNLRERELPLVCENKSEYMVEPNNTTDVFANEIGDTVLLNEITPMGLTLKSCRPLHKDISMRGKSMLIGKLENRVDVIVDDPSISRIHAKCENEGKRYYIEDLNTTNGTYLNDKRIVPYKLEEVKDGDLLRLGQVEYMIVIR